MFEPGDLERVLKAAENDCYKGKSAKPNGKFCRLVFDGLMCWKDTPIGVLANQSCSNNFIKSKKTGFATKFCGLDGEWYKSEITNETWTNYTECKPYVEKTVYIEHKNDSIYDIWLPIIQGVTQSGYILSTISLVMALGTFIQIKRLHCARNKLHMHLFVSFIMRAIMSLIKDGFFVKGMVLFHEINVYQKNGEPDFDSIDYSWLCKAIISLRNYFIISNYSFLLIEGAYLHNLLFFNFCSENGVLLYCCIGWSFPLLFILPWIALKIKNEDFYCWTTKNSKYVSALIDIPIGLTVFLNFILFSMIMRVLFLKLTSMYSQVKWVKYLKLLRAILILVPLFGIPYTISFVLSFYATLNKTFEIIWLFFDQTFIAYQGLFASLAYCLFNSDVQTEVMRKYRSFKDKKNELNRRSRTISHTTQLQLIEELQDYETRM